MSGCDQGNSRRLLSALDRHGLLIQADTMQTAPSLFSLRQKRGSNRLRQ
jgi:hypothetical protein